MLIERLENQKIQHRNAGFLNKLLKICDTY